MTKSNDNIFPDSGDASTSSLIENRSNVNVPANTPSKRFYIFKDKKDLINVFVVKGVIILTYLLVFITVWFRRYSLPSPLPANVTNTTGEFSGLSAWDHLTLFANVPHPYNSHQNLVVRDYLNSVLQSIQQEALTRNNTAIEIISQDPLNVTLIPTNSPITLCIVESSNILVRAAGLNGRNEALLVSAHYDSVPTSNGTTDDGIAIAVMLDIVRNLVYNPVENTVIFNFNNGEEVGLFGAKAFMFHPWAKDVRAFINLEGAGAGARPMLFRANNYDLVSLYANNDNRFPHASVIGNDIFKLGLIKSMTDFDVYSNENGIPGLDIAFYERRAFYHTIHDDLEHTSSYSVQHMGDMTLSSVRAIANSDYLQRNESNAEPSIYYDILGHSMIVWPWKTYLAVNIVCIVLVPIVYLVYLWFLKRNMPANSSLKQEFVLPIFRALGWMLLSVILAIIFCIIFAFLSTLVNPMVVYGEAYVGVFFFIMTSTLIMICIQWGWSSVEGRGQSAGALIHPLQLERAASLASIWFWWLAILLATIVAGLANIGALYYVFWFFLFDVLGVMSMIILENSGEVNLINASESRMSRWIRPYIWVVRFLITLVFPLILATDISITAVSALTQTLVDGTAPIFVLVFLAIASVTITIPLIPFFHRLNNFRLPVVTISLTFVGLFIALCLLFPYNAAQAPDKILYQQQVNLDTGAVITFVRTANDLEASIAAIPAASNRTCVDARAQTGYLVCTWPSIAPLFKPFEVNVTALPANDTRLAYVTLTTDETLDCMLDMSLATANIRSAYAVSQPVSSRIEPFNGGPSVIRMHRRGFDDPLFEFIVEYDAGNSIPIIAYCSYDEWTTGMVPDFLEVKNKLAEWGVLGFRGYGLVVTSKNVTLP